MNADPPTPAPAAADPSSLPPAASEVDPTLKQASSAEVSPPGANFAEAPVPAESTPPEPPSPPVSQRWVPPPAEELGRLLPQFEIECLIGHGGMGAVYKARQLSLDRTVAIKLLPAEVASPDFLARFRREARMLARLQHPAIVAVHEFGQTAEGHLYFVMEYVDGTDLQRLMRQGGLTAARSLEVIVQVCEALHYAHGQGLIHRDIKPANVLITRDGRCKLADFGLARPLEAEASVVTDAAMVMGTPAYMAPEQWMGVADRRADIYSLGVVLYEMLTGARPHGTFAPPSRKVPVDARLDEIVERALQEEPDRRYQEAREMQTDVEQVQTAPLSPRERAAAARLRRRRAVAIITTSTLFLVLGILAGIIWHRTHHATPTATSLPTSPPAASSPLNTDKPDVLGRKLCFEDDDWKRGIPLLAANGGIFQRAAAAERAYATTGTELDVARLWKAAGDQAELPHRWHCYRRARNWYRRALDSAALRTNDTAWYGARNEMIAMPVLKAKLRLQGETFHREVLEIRRTSMKWSTQSGVGPFHIIGDEKQLPAFSFGYGKAATHEFSRTEIAIVLPDGVDFTTAKLTSTSMGGKTGRWTKAEMIPSADGFSLTASVGERQNYLGSFTFDLTITFGVEGAGIPSK